MSARYCMNVNGDMLCDGPQGHDDGCTFVLGWEFARKLEDELISLATYAGDTTNELRETRKDRDEGWRQHNQSEIGRLNAESALRKADKAASRAHDAMWAMDFDKTSAGTAERDAWMRLRKQASDEIWKLHEAVRSLLGEQA